MERWKSYFGELLNEANGYHLQEKGELLHNMKNGKAPGLSGVTSDLLKGAWNRNWNDRSEGAYKSA